MGVAPAAGISWGAPPPSAQAPPTQPANFFGGPQPVTAQTSGWAGAPPASAGKLSL